MKYIIILLFLLYNFSYSQNNFENIKNNNNEYKLRIKIEEKFGEKLTSNFFNDIEKLNYSEKEKNDIYLFILDFDEFDDIEKIKDVAKIYCEFKNSIEGTKREKNKLLIKQIKYIIHNYKDNKIDNINKRLMFKLKDNEIGNFLKNYRESKRFLNDNLGGKDNNQKKRDNNPNNVDNYNKPN